ncbi:multidrug efflux SMR transporter [Zavarzinia compransoris]|nr:multidrug efflux SMR transporter [Zavarzinia marina]
MTQAYAALFVAILLELAGTSFLQASQQFTRPLPTVVMAVCYIASFYVLSLALKVIPVSIAYATWSGLGIVLIAIIGYTVFGQSLDWPAVVGIALIVAGVIVVNGFSSTVGHP